MAIGEIAFDSGNVVSAFVGTLGGVVGTVLYQEFKRSRRKVEDNIQEKIDWYDELRALANEIQNDGEVSMSVYESKGEMDVKEFLVEGSIEDKEEQIEIAEDWIKSRCDMYQDRLRKHWAQAPSELDDELDNTISYLYQELVPMSNVSSLGGNLSRLKSIGDYAEEIVRECEGEISRLEDMSVHRELLRSIR